MTYLIAIMYYMYYYNIINNSYDENGRHVGFRFRSRNG